MQTGFRGSSPDALRRFLALHAVPYIVLFVVCSIQAATIPIYNINQISYRRTFVWGTMPFGALIGGYIGTALGVQATFVIGAVISALAVLWLIPLRERVAIKVSSVN